MAYRSSGNLEKDIKDIAIQQMGGNKAYNALDSDGKGKIDSYAEDLTGAIKAFLQRQEFNITDMEAVGMIQPGQVNVVGSPAAQSNVVPIPISVQISQTSNKVGLPQVFQNVKTSVIKLLKSED
ncbi:MAG: hypothetical protein CBE47_03620 [Pelagibacteraceae bacterium TMED287]|nr:MAG: hypothetical protein CBE47_03620 [Pelagibacteraceae bacterium TMED287]